MPATFWENSVIEPNSTERIANMSRGTLWKIACARRRKGLYSEKRIQTGLSVWSVRPA